MPSLAVSHMRVIYRSIKELGGIKRDIEAAGGTASVVKCDVSKASDVKAAIEYVEAVHGTLPPSFSSTLKLLSSLIESRHKIG